MGNAEQDHPPPCQAGRWVEAACSCALRCIFQLGFANLPTGLGSSRVPLAQDKTNGAAIQAPPELGDVRLELPELGHYLRRRTQVGCAMPGEVHINHQIHPERSLFLQQIRGL